jgi:uncharacterized protein YcbX
MAAVKHLYHYPVKGLTPQPLDRVTLSPGEGFPSDRVFGLARFDSGFDPSHPAPLPKTRFFMLQKEERLAGLETWLEPDTGSFTIRIKGHLAHRSNLFTAEGTASAVAFFSTMFDLAPSETPTLAHAAPHRFTDVAVGSRQMMNAISLCNLSSVAELADRIGKPVDPLRFRANVYFEGWAPFSELERIGDEFLMGAVRLRLLRRTRRCAATEVNPVTARRDLPVPRLLLQHYGHADMGVYAEVLSGGQIAPGDVVK